jgi:AraC-like DNA-binding protein
MPDQGQRGTTDGTPPASGRGRPRASALSERAAVFPMHPFSGLLSLAVEKGWRLREVFQGFEFDRAGRPVPGQHVNYLQAREILLRARRAGGAETAALSGARKALPNLGVIGLGILAHETVGDALAFGLEYQRLAGSMLNVSLEIRDAEASIVARDLFPDAEVRGFLHADHLLTAVNALAHLPARPLALKRVELEGDPAPDLLRRLEQAFHCPVAPHAASSRLVFGVEALSEALRFSDSVTAQVARQACERELAALGLSEPAQASVRAFLLDGGDRLRSPAEMATTAGVSVRTLHRMLAAEGLKYAELAEEVRMERARKLLAQGMSTEDVAVALDYSDGRSFRRAFERWTGESPASFRRHL